MIIVITDTVTLIIIYHSTLISNPNSSTQTNGNKDIIFKPGGYKDSNKSVWFKPNKRVGIGTPNPESRLHNTGAYTQEPLSSDPVDPSPGNSVQWVSDGSGSGDAGDVMMKINVGGTVKTTTLVDYSAI